MTEQVGGIEYVVDADLRPFIKNTEELDRRLGDMGKSLDSTNSQIRGTEDSARAATKATGDLSSGMAKAGKDIASMGEATEKATASMANAGAAAETEAQAIERIAKTVSNAYPIMNQYNEANDSLVQSGRRATAAMEEEAQAKAKAAQKTKESTDALSSGERQQARMANSLRNVKKATEEEAAALTKLMARIDPASAKVRSLYIDMDLLTAAFNKGMISPAQYADALKKLEAQINKVEGGANRGVTAMDAFKFALAPIAAAITAVKVLAWAKDFSALAEQMSVARVQVMRLTDSTDNGTANFEALMQVSQRMGSTMADTQKVWAKFAYTLGEMGKSDAEIITLTETVQQLGALGGTSADQVAMAVDAITRAAVNGSASSRDLITILRQAPEVGRAIASQLNIPLKELQKGLKDGSINGEDMIDALLGGTEKVNAEFAKLPRMVSEAGNAMETAFGNAFLKINDALGASTKLAWIMDKISNGVNITTGNIPQEVKLNELMLERQGLMNGIEKANKSILGGMYKGEMEKSLIDVEKQILDIQNQRIEAQKKESAEKKKYNDMMSNPERTSETGDKEAQKARERIELLKLEGVAKAKAKALQKLDADATEKDKTRAMALAVEEYELTEQLAAKKKASREAESKSKKDANKSERDAAKAAKDALKNTEENTKAITDMAVALSLAGLKGKELAQAQALLKLNKWATPEDIAKMKELALAMDAVNQAKADKASVAAVDPLVGEDQRFQAELKELTRLNDAKLVENDRYLELKTAAEYQHSQTMQKLAEEDFARQSFTNQFLMDGINAMAQATTSTLSGLLSGTMDAKSAMQGFANVILNQAVGAIVELGFTQVKNALITKTVQAAAAASYATGVAAQVQATSFLAAQAAFASTAAIPVTGPALAPAAATAAFSTAQGLGAPATTFAAASGRFNGGSVQQDGMYKVNEGGAPEIFNAANGSQYMMPNARGEVISNAKATKGGGAQSITMNFYMNEDGQGGTSETSGNERSRQLMDTMGMVCVEVLNRESQQGGLLWENFGNGG